MNMEMPCLDLEYMELDQEERLTERDALMLGLVREVVGVSRGWSVEWPRRGVLDRV